MEVNAHDREAVNKGSNGTIANQVMTGDVTPPVIAALNKINPISVTW